MKWLALLVLLLHADTLRLKNGQVLEGKILSEEGGKIRLRLASGEISVDRADVDKIEYGPSPAEQIATRRAALDAKDAAAVLELAKFAAAKGHAKEALEIARLGDSPECRDFAKGLVEPEVRRRAAEIANLVRLGLWRRARELASALAAEIPEAKDRAVVPVEPPRRARVDDEAGREIDAWFEKGGAAPSRASLAEYLAAIRRGPRVEAGPTGLLERKTPEGVPYLLRIPKAYDPKFPLRLLITLHGTGGSPRAALAAWGRSLEGEEDLAVAAPDGGNPGWGNSRAGHERVLSVLRDVQQAYAIDLDRVALDGASMGAHGAFFLAMYHPDRWAAIAPRAGSARLINFHPSGGMPDLSPAPAILDNLRATPVFLVAGAKDLNSPVAEVRMTKRRLEAIGAPLVYREHAEGGHEWFADEDADVLDFLRHHARDPYPAKVKLVTREVAFGRAWWVELLESTRNPRIRIQHIGMDRKELEVRSEFDVPAELEAEADRARNRITVKCSGVKELRVWLADELVDLDRPVTIVVNGAKEFEGRVERSLQVALEDCKRRGDRGLPYVASVKVRAR